MAGKTLIIDNLNYKSVLTGVSFTWSQGEKIALMGPNGSGKSTLARLLSGFIEPTSGEISLYDQGQKVPCPSNERWQHIGFVGQHPRRQTIGATVAEEISFGLVNWGFDAQNIKKMVSETLKFIGMEGKENQSPNTLSGGERQRLVTAAILAMQPSFLILDEALTMLDMHSQERMLSLLNNLSKPIGQLWITHDRELAKTVDRLLLIKDGKLMEAGPPRNTLENPELLQEYAIYARGQHSAQPQNLASSGETPKSTGIRSTNHEHRTSILGEASESRPGTRILRWERAKYEARLTLNMDIGEKEFIGVLGPSGAGKTTILESIIGLHKLTEGHFYAWGQQQSKKNLGWIRNKARLVLQEAGEYFIGRTAYDEVYYTQGSIGGKSLKNGGAVRARNLEFLAKFGLTESMAAKYPEHLSGGEKQRVALAAALHTLPEVLLLDEPMLGLDNHGRATFNGILRELEESDQKLTFLFVTHDLEDVLGYADRLWLVENGEITLDCKAEEWQKYRSHWQEAGVRCP